MLAASPPQSALSGNVLQQIPLHSSRIVAHPAQPAVHRRFCRNKHWRIQAFGGLFGGGKKDTAGKKVALMDRNALQGVSACFDKAEEAKAPPALPGQAMQEMQEHRVHNMSWLQGERAQWLSSEFFALISQTFFSGSSQYVARTLFLEGCTIGANPTELETRPEHVLPIIPLPFAGERQKQAERQCV